MRSLAHGSGAALLAGAFFAGALALAGAAGAADPGADRPVVEQLLDILLQQQSITRDQYEALLEQSQREQAAAAAQAAEVAKAAALAQPPTPPVASGPAWN